MEQTMLEAMMSRKSVRSYTDQMVSDADIEKVLKAGQYAANGRGRMATKFVVVKNREIRDELSKMNADIMGVESNPYYDAPTIVLVFASADNYNRERDGSLVLGNMMLAAHSIGLASCWINREDAMFASAEGKAIMAELGLPDGLVGIGALSLGYASSHPKTVKPRKEGYYKILK